MLLIVSSLPYKFNRDFFCFLTFFLSVTIYPPVAAIGYLTVACGSDYLFNGTAKIIRDVMLFNKV